MRDVLLFAALGLGAGALIASIALGVVLIYRGSGVINVATGAIAMLAAYIFWALRTDYFGFQLSTAPAFVLTLACMAAFGVLIELAIFRPLRNTAPLAKLAASLGLLLVLESGMIVIFGNSLKSAPAVLPTDTVMIFGRVVPGRSVSPRRDRGRRGSGARGALPLDAVRALDPGGVGERGLGHARGPLAGSPGRREHRARLRRRGRAGRPGRAADRTGRADAGVPGRSGPGRRPARRVHVVLRRVLRRPRDRRGPVAPDLLGDAELVPDGQGRSPAARAPRALRLPRHRPRALPARGKPPGPRRARGTAAPGRAPARAAAEAHRDCGDRRGDLPDRLPVRLPAGADQLAAGRRHLPLARRDRRLRRSDLGGPARAGRRRRLHDVASDHRPRRRVGGVSDLAPDRSGHGDDRRPPDRDLCATRQGGQPRGRHARGRGRARAVRVPQRALGRRGQGVARDPACARRARPVAPRVVQGPGRQAPEPCVRVPRPRRDAPALHARRERAAREPGAADARSPLERARSRCSRDQRAQHEARGVRHRRVHRRDGRRALRVQLRLGQLQPLRRPGGARPDRVRVLRRHHHGLRRGDRRQSARRRDSSRTPSTGGSASPATGRC